MLPYKLTLLAEDDFKEIARYTLHQGGVGNGLSELRLSPHA